MFGGEIETMNHYFADMGRLHERRTELGQLIASLSISEDALASLFMEITIGEEEQAALAGLEKTLDFLQAVANTLDDERPDTAEAISWKAIKTKAKIEAAAAEIITEMGWAKDDNGQWRNPEYPDAKLSKARYVLEDMADWEKTK